METVIPVAQIRHNIEHIFDRVDQEKHVFIKKGHSLYRLEKTDSLHDIGKMVKQYIAGYKKKPEHIDESKGLVKLATRVLKKEEW